MGQQLKLLDWRESVSAQGTILPVYRVVLHVSFKLGSPVGSRAYDAFIALPLACCRPNCGSQFSWVDGTNAANLNTAPGGFASGLYFTWQPDCSLSGEVYLMADAGWATVGHCTPAHWHSPLEGIGSS
jgi:hypothetical protein